VDTTLVDAVVAASLPHLGQTEVLFLPTQAVGKSNEHARFPGTLTLSAGTLIALWMELGACVAAAGFRKLLLFNSHGGQVSVMDIVARDLRAKHDLLVYSSNWYTLPIGDAVMGQFPPEEHRFGIHAGDIETSMMLASASAAHVDMAQAQDFHSSSQDRAQQYAILGNGSSAKMGWQIQDYNPLGACGNAASATAAKGRSVIDAAGLQLAKLLGELAQLPAGTLRASHGL
jgi:creatinine amidohydrolase